MTIRQGASALSVATRADRDRRLRRRDRWWQAGAVTVAVSAGSFAMFGGTAGDRLGAAQRLSAPTSLPHRIATMQTVLWAHVDRAKNIDLAALVGFDDSHRIANVVLVPTATAVEVPALDIQAVNSLVKSGSQSTFATAVANATGIRIDRTALVDDTTLAKLVAITPRFAVNLRAPVSVDDGALVLSAGPQDVGASTAVRLMQGIEPSGSIAHLVTVQAIWQGWLSALAANPIAMTRLAGVMSGDVFVRLARIIDNVHFDTLPVSSVAASDTERFEIRSRDLANLVVDRFSLAQLGFHGARPATEILNGVGKPGLAQAMANLVVPAGSEVRLTGNTVRFDQRSTRVVYYRDRDRAFGDYLVRQLGVGQVVRGTNPISVVDITVVIGRDFAARFPH